MKGLGIIFRCRIKGRKKVTNLKIKINREPEDLKLKYFRFVQVFLKKINLIIPVVGLEIKKTHTGWGFQ